MRARRAIASTLDICASQQGYNQLMSTDPQEPIPDTPQPAPSPEVPARPLRETPDTPEEIPEQPSEIPPFRPSEVPEAPDEVPQGPPDET